LKPDSKPTISNLTLVDVPKYALLDFDLGAKRKKRTSTILRGMSPQKPVETGIDKEATQPWLTASDIFQEKEDFICVS
jgi:hypothetical protein